MLGGEHCSRSLLALPMTGNGRLMEFRLLYSTASSITDTASIRMAEEPCGVYVGRILRQIDEY